MHVVLVHGAWQGSWAWDGVIAQWRDPDRAMIALDLPSVSGVGDLETDARAVAAFANDLNDEIVLVGHSYGGAVITQASPSVRALRGGVFLAALRPLPGRSTAHSSDVVTDPSRLDSAIVRRGDTLDLEPATAAAALFENPTSDVATASVAKRHPQPIATFVQPCTSEWPAAVPTHYFVCTHDQTVPVALQRQFASESSSWSDLPFGHCPQLEHPLETATALQRVIEQFAPEASW